MHTGLSWTLVFLEWTHGTWKSLMFYSATSHAILGLHFLENILKKINRMLICYAMHYPKRQYFVSPYIPLELNLWPPWWYTNTHLQRINSQLYPISQECQDHYCHLNLKTPIYQLFLSGDGCSVLVLFTQQTGRLLQSLISLNLSTLPLCL